MFTHMRIARPVTNLERSFLMYSYGLGLQKVSEFTDHDGFNGIMLGNKGLAWHIEMTVCQNHPVPPSQTEEDLLVLYYPEKDEWEQTCARMSEAGFKEVNSFNPYWDVNGKTFIDPDKYRVVIQNKAWV
ncbi:VOC family protein [Kosakonia sp. MUSA4]|uniref:VOC family protein n=1 Tax=Kosakonia sp. MUSA4 TaxID=2067958 RepID=UPI0015973910|nr:VOC family protein [Kosakonia sp. MUSA4]QJT81031.1 prolyl endopeptidase [Kosakonia sp. MUSA4]